MHRALGFEETERVVFFRKSLRWIFKRSTYRIFGSTVAELRVRRLGTKPTQSRLEVIQKARRLHIGARVVVGSTGQINGPCA